MSLWQIIWHKRPYGLKSVSRSYTRHRETTRDFDRMVDFIDLHPRSQSLELMTRSRQDTDDIIVVDNAEEPAIPGIVFTNKVEQISEPNPEASTHQPTTVPAVATSAWGRDHEHRTMYSFDD